MNDCFRLNLLNGKEVKKLDSLNSIALLFVSSIVCLPFWIVEVLASNMLFGMKSNMSQVP